MHTDNWLSYKEKAFDYQMAIIQNQIIYSSSKIILKNFPENFPLDWQSTIYETLGFFCFSIKGFSEYFGNLPPDLKAEAKKNIHDIWDELKKDPQKSITIRKKISDNSELLDPFLHLFFLVNNSKKELADISIDFDRIVNSLELVMNFSHLDAFISDSIRCICYERPEILKQKRRNIDWEIILSFQTYEEILDFIVDQMAYESGHNVNEKIKTLEKEFKFDLSIPEKVQELIFDGEQARHIFIHNGGRISNEYLNKKPNTNRNLLGSILPITNEFVSDTALCLHLLAKKIFSQAAEKIFNKDENDYKGLFPFDSEIWANNLISNTDQVRPAQDNHIIFQFRKP